MTILTWLLAAALVAAGLLGIVLPVLPGTFLIFAGLWLAAWAERFTRVGAGTLAAIGVLAVAAYGVDLAAAAFGVRHVGASRRAIAGAAAGTLLGLLFGLPGLIAGPFLGAMAGELTARRDLIRAGRVGLAAWLGFVVGAAVKIGLAFAMIGLFLAARFLL